MVSSLALRSRSSSYDLASAPSWKNRPFVRGGTCVLEKRPLVNVERVFRQRGRFFQDARRDNVVGVGDIMGKLSWLRCLLVVFACCGDSHAGGAGSTGGPSGAACIWHGNCSTTAPQGAFDCSGNSVVRCENGSWKTVVGCGTLENGDGYSCTCKGGCGARTTVCSYASDVCEGYSFGTLP